MLPKIMAQQAEAKAANKLNPGAKPLVESAKPELAGPNGLAVNFPGFFHPPAIKSTPSADVTGQGDSLMADVNQDGKPDLVTVDVSCRINVLLNSGSGLTGVTSTNTSEVDQGVSEAFLYAVDVNGDGYPDLELVDTTNANVYIFLNNGPSGNGTFADATVVPISLPGGDAIGFNTNGYGGDVIFADVTGDSKPDMVVLSGQYPDSTSTSITVQTFAGAGDGTFPSVTQSQNITLAGTTLDGSYHSLKAIDMNGDGKLDLVYPAHLSVYTGSGPSPTVRRGLRPNGMPVTAEFIYNYVLTGTGQGSFSALTAVDGGTTGIYAVGAGITDIYDTYVGTLSNASGMFVVAPTQDSFYSQHFSSDGSRDVAVVTPNVDLPNEQAMSYVDVTGDGKMDAVMYTSTGYIAIYPGLGDGTFAPAASQRFVSGQESYTEPQPMDYDGDGVMDIVGVDQYSGAALFHGLGGGQFKAAPVLAPASEDGYNLSPVLTGDLAGHGFADVLLYDSTTTPASLVTAVNDGHGNFTYETAMPTAGLTAISWVYVQPTTIDLNGDQKQDLLIVAPDGVYGALNNGDGTFAAPVKIALTTADTACPVNYMAVGDLNNDGAADMLFPFGTCTVGSPDPAGYYTLVSNGGTFPNNFTASYVTFGAIPYAANFADFNNDGKLDLMLMDMGQSHVTIVPGVGDGTFNTGAQVTPYGAPNLTYLIAADYDGDGKQDITALGIASGGPGLTHLKGNGDFTFEPPTYEAVSDSIAFGAYADFNGDGLPDLVLSGSLDSSLDQLGMAYMVNLGAGNFSAPILLPAQGLGNVGFGYGTPLMLADFNGDGAMDVLGTSDYTGGLFYNSGAISLALTSSSASALQGSSVTLTATLTPGLGSAQASGTVSFYANGVLIGVGTVSGNVATLTLSTLPAGNEAITAVYSGDVNYNIAQSSTSVTTTVAVSPRSAATLTLATSAATAVQGSPVTLTATLTPTSGTAAVTGTVTFYDNGVVIGTADVTGNGATLTIASLPVGANAITAVYSGDTNYTTATTGSNVTTSVAVTPLASAFTMTAVSGSSLDLTVGQTGTATFTVTGNATFNGTISFTCAGAPKGTSCTILPSTVTLAGAQSATVGVVLDTTAPNNHYNAANFMPGWMKTTGGITLAGGLLLLLPSRRRRQIWPLVLFAMLGLGAAVSLTGCDHKYEGTPAGSYTVNVTATSGAVTQSSTINMTIHK